MKPLFRPGDFKRVVDDSFDKWIFLAAFTIGAICIGIFRFFELPPFALLLVPTIILGGYTIYVMRTARMSMSLDRAGDNIYYLGLLFTLVTLSFSLFQVFRPGAQSEAVFELMASFGLALWSTILGMFLRVFVQQFRSDPADVEKEVRADLTEAVRSLRAELYAMTADVNSYRRASVQSIEELQGELSTSIKDVTANATQGISTTSEQLVRTSTNLENVGIKQGEMLETLLTTIDTTVRELVQRLNGIEIDTGLVASKFDGVAKTLEHTADQLASRAAAEQTAMEALEKLVSSLQGLSDPALHANIITSVENIAELAKHTTEVKSSFLELKNALDSTRTALDTAREEDLKGLKQLLEDVREHADLSERSTREVQQGLLESVRALRSEVKT